MQIFIHEKYLLFPKEYAKGTVSIEVRNSDFLWRLPLKDFHHLVAYFRGSSFLPWFHRNQLHLRDARTKD